MLTGENEIGLECKENRRTYLVTKFQGWVDWGHPHQNNRVGRKLKGHLVQSPAQIRDALFPKPSLSNTYAQSRAQMLLPPD